MCKTPVRRASDDQSVVVRTNSPKPSDFFKQAPFRRGSFPSDKRNTRFSKKWCNRLDYAIFFLEYPFVLPADNGLAVLELDGEPDVAGIAGMLRSPDVGHEDVAAVVERQDVGALAHEGLVRLRAAAGVRVLRPRSPDAGRAEHAGLVGLPAGTAAGNHPVGAVVLEDGRCLIVAGGCHAGVAAGVVQVVGGQLGDVQRQVLLAAEDVVRLAVIIHIKCHVACHLARAEVALHVEAFVHGLLPRGRPVLVVEHASQRVSNGNGGGVKLPRPHTRVGSRRVEELVRAFGAVGHGHAVAGGVVALPLQFEVEPHAEFLRHGIVDDLRTLQDAAALNVAVGRGTAAPACTLARSLVGDAEGDAAVAPVDEVFRGVAHHADEGVARAVVLMLAEPVPRVAILQDAAAVGVDMPTAVIVPQLAAANCPRLLLPCVPILFQTLGLGLGDVDDTAVLRRREVLNLHLSLAEAAQGREGLEVAGLDEAEVVGPDAEHVVHHYPLVLTDALPYVGCLAGAVLGVNLLDMVVVEVVNLVADHILDAAGVLLIDIRHEIAAVGHRTDVGIEHLHRRVGALEQQLRLRFERREGLVGIRVVELGVAAGVLADGEVDHRLTDLGVPYRLRGPRAAYLAETLREELVDAGHVVRPMDEVVAGHEHQTAVVAPSESFRPLPLRGADAFLLAKDVEVGHGDVELAVGGAVDVRVADAMLLGNAVARDDRLAIVHGPECVAVVADGHEQRVRWVAEIGEEVGTHVLLCELLRLDGLRGDGHEGGS